MGGSEGREGRAEVDADRGVVEIGFEFRAAFIESCVGRNHRRSIKNSRISNRHSRTTP